MAKKKSAASQAGSIPNKTITVTSSRGNFIEDLMSNIYGEKPDAYWNEVETGRRFSLKYEPQVGQPIDGGDERFRQYSPFVMSFVLPSDISTFFGALGGSENVLDSFFSEISALNGSSLYHQSGDAFLENAAFNSAVAASGGRGEPSFAGTTQVYSLIQQATVLANIPPLQVLVNPNSMSVSYTKIQEFDSRTRNNRIFRAWGEEQPNISFSFSTGGFIAGTRSQFWTPQVESPSGLQYASKKNSAAWQNFMKIFQMYQNLSLIYDKVYDTEAHLDAGAIAIDYDQMRYIGLMESFDFSYSEEDPHRMQFEMSFIVSEMEDLSGSQNYVLPQTSESSATLSGTAKATSSVIGTTVSAAINAIDREET